MASSSFLPRVIFLSTVAVFGAMAALPEGLKGCKYSSKDFNKCLTNQVQNALNVFKDGNKKMGLSPLEPLKFQKLMIDQGTGPVAIKLEFRDLQLKGVTNIKIMDSKCDWKTMVYKAKLDNLEIIGDYTISGKVLVLPIAGSGKSNITMTDIDVLATIYLKEVTKGGKKYFHVEEFTFDIKPKRTFFNLENLFNGDKALGDNMNLFLNENHEQIINELKPAITKALSQGFKQITNLIFSKIPANEIKIP